MSIFNDSLNEKDETTKIRLWQPEFPLKYDSTFGPYRPITTAHDSYNRNFINLLLTNPGEWPMNPDLGIGVRRYLFEPYGSDLLQELRPKIDSQLEKYLPRVRLVDLSFSATAEDKDENFMKITIKYSVLGNGLFSSAFFLNAFGLVTVKSLIRKTIGENFSDRIGSVTSDLTVI